MYKYSVLIIAISLLLGLVILLAELRRRKVRGGVDFLMVCSVLYFVVYGVVPIWLQFVDPFVFRLRYAEDLLRIDFDDIEFLWASVTALCGYVVLAWSYSYFRVASYRFIRPFPEVPAWKQKLAAHFLFGTGLCSLFIHAWNAGGIMRLVTYSTAYRVGRETSLFANESLEFVKYFMGLITWAAFIYYAIYRSNINSSSKYIYRILFLVSILISITSSGVILGGRLGLLIILAAMINGYCFINEYKQIQYRYIVMLVALAMGITLYGRQIFMIFYDPNLMAVHEKYLASYSYFKVNAVFVDVSFPYLVLANTISAVPDQVYYRFGIDYILALAYFIPAGAGAEYKQVLGIQVPKSISYVNSELFGRYSGVPVDFLSFGIFNAGYLGVLILCALLGIGLSVLNRIFPAEGNNLTRMLRAAWVTMFPFVIMYADPKEFGFRMFSVFLTTGILWVLVNLDPIRRT
ncbi:MAG: hypothetical protein AB2L11_01730 [Syntrophobacteraceae bacterium]